MHDEPEDWFDDSEFEDYPTFGEEDEWDADVSDDQAEGSDDPWGWWNDPFEAVYDAGAELLGGVKDTVDRAVERVTEIPEEVTNQATKPALEYLKQQPPADPKKSWSLFGVDVNLDAEAVLTVAAVGLAAMFVADQLFARGTGTAALVARATGSR